MLFRSASAITSARAATPTPQVFDSGATSCAEPIAIAEKLTHMPDQLLRSVALAESGKWDPVNRAKIAWPWTVTSGNDGRYFPTKAEAIAWVKTLRARGQAGLAQLKAMPSVDAGKTVAIGYCFGGISALELARTGAEMTGLVGFHCNLNATDPAEAKNIKCKVLILNGADDPVVPDSETAAFEKEMRDANVDWQLVRYGNTVHSFTNPDADGTMMPGIKFNAQSDARSWLAMKNFFEEVFA